MERKKEIWIQFNDFESYLENEEKLFTILEKSPGKCNVIVYLKNEKQKSILGYTFDELKISILKESFSEENVACLEKKLKSKEFDYFSPHLIQIIPCNHEIYAILKESDGNEIKRKVLMYGLFNDGEVYPICFDNDFCVYPLIYDGIYEVQYELKE